MKIKIIQTQQDNFESIFFDTLKLSLELPVFNSKSIEFEILKAIQMDLIIDINMKTIANKMNVFSNESLLEYNIEKIHGISYITPSIIQFLFLTLFPM